MTIFKRLQDGERVDMRDPQFAEAVSEMSRSSKLCHKINQAEPDEAATAPLLRELMGDGLDPTAHILAPLHVDFGCQMHIGPHVFINHSLTAMSAAGIHIGEGTFIGPNVQLLTDNHDLHDKLILVCRPIHIGRNVWIGAGASVLPGVTIGDNSVVGTGAVVTKDVPASAVVAGVPARVIRQF